MSQKFSSRLLVSARVGNEILGLRTHHKNTPAHKRLATSGSNKTQQVSQTTAELREASRGSRGIKHGGVCTFVCATGTQAADLMGPAVDLLLLGPGEGKLRWI